MLAAIVQEKENHYYIYLEEENNINTISVIHTNNENTKCLTEEEAKQLLNRILSSALTYKEKQGEYDVYLDEADNKRYFKNGKENYQMFFEQNGISAIEYNNDNKISTKSKHFQIIVKNTLFGIIAGTIVGNLSQPTIMYKIIDPIYTNEITVDEMKDLINESKYLSEEEKSSFINEPLLQEIKRVACNNRNFSLRIKLSDIRVKSFYQESSNLLGYYNPLEPSNIYLRDFLEPGTEQYNDTYIHEFIHLLQEDNYYYYIKEACAEIFSSEFYDQPNKSYEEEVKRIKILMEIIGPKPVLECNYSGNEDNFEESIKQYLNEEDSKALLKLFNTSSNYFSDEVNDKIDFYLSKMYKEKTGEDIQTNELINSLYQNGAMERLYFNSSKQEFYMAYFVCDKIETIDTPEIEEIMNKNQVESFIYQKQYICTKEEYDLLDMTEGKITQRGCYLEKQNNITINKDNLYEYKGHQYDKEEALRKGLLNEIYYYKKPIVIDDYKKINPNVGDVIQIIFKDGTRGYASYTEDNKWERVKHFRITRINAPSIYSLFPEQMKPMPQHLKIDENVYYNPITNEEKSL